MQLHLFPHIGAGGLSNILQHNCALFRNARFETPAAFGSSLILGGKESKGLIHISVPIRERNKQTVMDCGAVC